MLSINNINKTFNRGTVNENPIFKDLSLDINEGDFITIIGSNGAGKSTLLNVISGNIEADSGQICIDGKDIARLPEHKRTKFISRVYQNPFLGVSPSMTILENMSLAFNKGNRFGLGRAVSKQNVNKFKYMLSQLGLGLEDKIHNKVGLLSGGQRQSISLIMATMKKPKLLLLDEHTAALDPKTSAKIIEITKEIVEENNITTLMVTHDLNHVLGLGNRVLMMHSGNVILDIKGKEKYELTIEKLLGHFDNANVMLSDRMLMAK